MGAIKNYSENFISAQQIFARVKRELSSFDVGSTLNENDWYDYVMDILHEFNSTAYEENQAVLKIERYKAKLPNNFKQLFSAYGCTRGMSGISTKGTQQHKLDDFSIYVENTCTKLNYNKCCIDSCVQEVDKITVKTYLETGEEHCSDFNHLTLLSLGANVKKFCNEHCPNIHINHCEREIEINNGYVYTNFNGFIFMQYYGLPLDDDNMPMIPENTLYMQAITEYIKFKVMTNLHINSDAPDLERRVGLQNQIYQEVMNRAIAENKLPSYAGVMNLAKKYRHRFKNYELRNAR